MNYDTILKSILQSLANSLTTRLTGARAVRQLNVEFPDVGRRVPDLVLELDDGRILHLEVQSGNDPKMVYRMLKYWLLLRERFEGVPIVQHVLYIGLPACNMINHIQDGEVTYRFNLTDIRELDEQLLLASNSPADRMLAILTRMENERATIRGILQSWKPIPRGEQADLQRQLMLLSGLRKLQRVVAEEVQNMPIIIDVMENDVIREWIEKGLEQGREQGSDIGQAKVLTRLLTKRFGSVPPHIEQKIQAAHSPQLEDWALRLLDANSIDEVFAE